jgi:hypothetical protein
MTTDEARQLVVALTAAFPFPRTSDATFALYADKLAELHSHDVALAAVNVLIDSSARLPTIAAIRSAYQQTSNRLAAEREDEQRRRADTHGLPSGDDRPAIPEEAVTFLRDRLGIDVDQILRDMPGEQPRQRSRRVA